MNDDASICEALRQRLADAFGYGKIAVDALYDDDGERFFQMTFRHNGLLSVTRFTDPDPDDGMISFMVQEAMRARADARVAR